jgi:hypothetical protein
MAELAGVCFYRGGDGMGGGIAAVTVTAGLPRIT